MDAMDRALNALHHLQHIDNNYKAKDDTIIIEETDKEDFSEFLDDIFEIIEKYIRGRRWYDD